MEDPNRTGWVQVEETLGAVSVPPQCDEPPLPGYVNCPMDAAPNGLKFELGGGDDQLNVNDPKVVVAASLGVGDDSYGTTTPAGAPAITVNGEDGDDRLDGGDSAETLRGGLGVDEGRGGGGADQVFGDAGNDLLGGDLDTKSADVINGGSGFDRIDPQDWGDIDLFEVIKVTVTLDGLANDGRTGEGDNVLSVEKIHVSQSGTFVGSAGAEDIFVTGASPSSLKGLGGNDKLKGGDKKETIDGGAGSDTVIGGRADDVLIGGPGRDTIYGD